MVLIVVICVMGVWVIGLLYLNNFFIENLLLLLMLGYVVSFSIKFFDICVSEVGKVYG